jgi:DNA-binding GntR family transcriptional regulator
MTKSEKTRSNRGKTALFARIGRASLHEQAAEELRRSIIRGELTPGMALSEAEYSAILGVSRTPFREALKLLAAEHLVILRSNRSAIVAPLVREEVANLFEVMSGVERIGAELAAVRINERELKRLATLQERMEKMTQQRKLTEYSMLNRSVHELIVACARNPVLTTTHDWLMSRVERARFQALSSKMRWDESLREHQMILEALGRKDSDAAGHLLAQHVRRTGDVVTESLDAYSQNIKSGEPENAEPELSVEA